jgi:hypothetical protein
MRTDSFFMTIAALLNHFNLSIASSHFDMLERILVPDVLILSAASTIGVASADKCYFPTHRNA